MTAPTTELYGKEFDFVVVGGGTAGLTVATRLSEDPTVSVLVLEAGPANLGDSAILTPASFGSHFGKSQYDWGFSTEPQLHANNRAVYWARGKGLGGSSAINFFQYHRPHKSDVDAFEKLGNTGWNWELLKKYYNKSECFIPPETKTQTMSFDLAHHGTEGPLKVGYPVTFSGFEKPLHDTLANFGVRRAKEPFSGDNNGTWLTPVTIDPKDQIRSYAANMYYWPNADRKNLTVLPLARVTKLDLKKHSGIVTTTGVNFLHDEKTYFVSVRREVILSAGSIMNPQILELSGIGNKEILKKAEIEVILELPGVGSNVQEHVYSGSTYEVRREMEEHVLTFDCLKDPVEAAKQRELFKEGKGVFGMSAVLMSFVPLATISTEAETIYEDLRKSIQAGISAKKYTSGYEKQYHLQLEKIKNGEPTCEFVLTQTFSTVPDTSEPGKKYITMACFLNHPFSRGTIHNKSNNPLELPTIDPHYFEEEYDLRLLVEIFKFNRRLVQTEPLKSYLTEIEVNPGPECKTDKQIADYLKTKFNTAYHTIGSCSMLPLADGGVVDTKLRVYHSTNIRVVDISVVPIHIGAHMQATAYAIGELGADIIKGNV